MLIRFVKLTIAEQNIEAFELHFETVKDKIRASKGNLHVELLQDLNNPQIFFTHSHWESFEDLETYRHSAFFDEVWRYTKTLFSEKAEAWSLEQV